MRAALAGLGNLLIALSLVNVSGRLLRRVVPIDVPYTCDTLTSTPLPHSFIMTKPVIGCIPLMVIRK